MPLCKQLSKQVVRRLFPGPQQDMPLQGLYLEQIARDSDNAQRPFVYTNFISSLDGRIAVEHPQKEGHNVPESIANPRDWRLFQELAASADVLVTSARYIRELADDRAQDSLPLSNDAAFADLHAWRRDMNLSPQPAVVILSSSLELPLETLSAFNDREVYVATGRQADVNAVERLRQAGTKLLFTGDNRRVDGKQLVEVLAKQGFRNIYSIAGPGVLETLLTSGVLERLYLTQVHRLIGGLSFDTLLEGGLVNPPADFTLQQLYYDFCDEEMGQFFAIYETNCSNRTAGQG